MCAIKTSVTVNIRNHHFNRNRDYIKLNFPPPTINQTPTIKFCIPYYYSRAEIIYNYYDCHYSICIKGLISQLAHCFSVYGRRPHIFFPSHVKFGPIIFTRAIKI